MEITPIFIKERKIDSTPNWLVQLYWRIALHEPSVSQTTIAPIKQTDIKVKMVMKFNLVMF